MSNGLISLTQLRKSGLYFSNKTDGWAILTNTDSGKEILRVKQVHDMYPLETVMEAHARMGHVAPAAIRRLVKDGMVVGMKVDLTTPSSRSTPRSKAPWDLVWSDVWGPPDTAGIYLMRQKSEVYDKFRAFSAWVKTQFGGNIKALRSDRGGEYK